MKEPGRHPARRVRAVAGVFAVGLALVAVRLVQLQVVEHERWAEVSRSYRMREEIVPARRGWIVDRNGEVLARNEEVHDLWADPRHLADAGVALAGFSRKLGRPEAEVRREYSRRQILRGYRSHAAAVVESLLADGAEAADRIRGAEDGGDVFLLARGLDLRERDGIEAGLAAGGVRGVYFRSRDRRFRAWAREGALARWLGEVDEAGRGRGGIEEGMDAVLRGRDGRRLVERDSLGRELAVYRKEEEAAVDGGTVRLTVDARIQALLEDVLREARVRLGADKLAAVVQESGGGGILALADDPGGDLVWGEAFDPGALAGMFVGEGEETTAALRAYGFGEPTGVPLPGEAAGSAGDGRGGVAVTALQLVNAAGARARGGEPLPVRLVAGETREGGAAGPSGPGGFRTGESRSGGAGTGWVVSGAGAFPDVSPRWSVAVVVWEARVAPEFRSADLVAGPVLEEIARRVVASRAIRSEGSGREDVSCD